MSFLLAKQIDHPGPGVLLALFVFMAGSVWLGMLAQKTMEKNQFLEGYFLGNRGLGAWALALTATVQSGGTFMGVPAYVYAHGWSGAFFISAYMVVPLTGFAIIGKRLAVISRRANAVTVPDLLRARFDSQPLGLVASLVTVFVIGVQMLAQFKAGAVLMKYSSPFSGAFSSGLDLENVADFDGAYLVGLLVFSCAVIGYTLIGGFLASVWTDLFQSVMMFFGVLILFALVVVPLEGGLESATRLGVEHTSSEFLTATGVLKKETGTPFLPLGTAISLFLMWIIGGFATPASQTRLMAAANTEVMRRSVFILSLYNLGIYLPLIAISIAAHAMFAPNELQTNDEMIPRVTLLATQDLPGGSLLAGLIFAAPFGAVMATVSCFLIVISSALVQDIYHRLLNPHATERQLRFATTLVMIVVGGFGIVMNIQPPKFLQALIVFGSSGGAASLSFPAFMACYWKRATAAGAVASMLGGFFGFIVLYNVKAMQWSTLGGLDPFIWGLLISIGAGVAVSRITKPPESAERFF